MRLTRQPPTRGSWCTGEGGREPSRSDRRVAASMRARPRRLVRTGRRPTAPGGAGGIRGPVRTTARAYLGTLPDGRREPGRVPLEFSADGWVPWPVAFRPTWQRAILDIEVEPMPLLRDLAEPGNRRSCHDGDGLAVPAGLGLAGLVSGVLAPPEAAAQVQLQRGRTKFDRLLNSFAAARPPQGSVYFTVAAVTDSGANPDYTIWGRGLGNYSARPESIQAAQFTYYFSDRTEDNGRQHFSDTRPETTWVGLIGLFRETPSPRAAFTPATYSRPTCGVKGESH